MCGVAGIFNYETGRRVDAAVLDRMGIVLAHRGPDGSGTYRDDDAGLALTHRRLSILDLTTGEQPMSYGGGRFWTVFNGEIYNYRELRTNLEKRGHSFRTTSDTEVLVAMFAEFGMDAFARLNGIFGCALYDSKQHELVIARDRFGVKPIYFSQRQGSISFASEIKALLQDPELPLDLDCESLVTFLQLRYNPSPGTLLRSVRKLPPGHLLVAKNGAQPSVRSYWEDSPVTRRNVTEREAIDEYCALLEQSIKRQMVSDVPVGLLLSGGIDSAAVGLLMGKHAGYRVKTFSVGFEGAGDYNELDDAATTAALIGSEHFQFTITQSEYVNFFLNSFKITEEPIAEPTIPALHYVSRLAAGHVKVVLSGQGADEPLAGYRKYFAEKYLVTYGGFLRALPLGLLSRGFNRSERLKRGIYASQFHSELERFYAINTIFTPGQLGNLVLPGFAPGTSSGVPTRFKTLHTQARGLSDSLSRFLYLDVRTYLADDLLIFGDKVSMAHSLELRVPFLDNDLMSFLESLPGSFKLRGNTHKYIHRRALSRWLPSSILRRKKRGFLTPVDEWFRSDLGDVTRDLLNSSDSASKGIFDIRYANTLIDAHQTGRENYHRHLFALLSWELWSRAIRGVRQSPCSATGGI